MARSAGRLRDQPWASRVEIAEADATDAEQTRKALDGVEVAYYLIHTMGGGDDFAEADRRAATTFAAAAGEAGVGRIVYLGGLAPNEKLSPHMRSRVEVGEIFLGCGRARRGAAGGRHHRIGFGLLRDAAPSHRAAARDDDAAMGAHQDAAHRDPRRPALPRGLGGHRGGGEPLLRHRRPGRADLRRHDGRLRRGRGAAPPVDHPGSDAQPRPVEPLGGAGHPCARGAGPPAGGVAAQRGGLPRTRHRRPRQGSAGRTDRARGRPSSWPCDGSRRPRSSRAGPRPRPRARRATRCRPTPTGRAAASTSTRGPAASRRPRRHSGR